MIVLLTVLPDAPLRNPETGSIFNDSPLMDSLIFIITMMFLVAGICFGIGAKTITQQRRRHQRHQKTFAGLAGLIFLLLLISQFIAYFNFSNMPTVVAVKMADFLESADIGALWLLIGFILVIVAPRHHHPGRRCPKWAIFAPIFVPLFLRLDVAPADRAGRLPGRRLAGERDHAADGVPAVHRHRRPALQEGRRASARSSR